MNSQTNTTATAANPAVREWDLLKAIYMFRSEWFGYLARSIDDDKTPYSYEPANDVLANWKTPAMNWNEAFEALKLAETEAATGDTPIVPAMIRATLGWLEANPLGSGRIMSTVSKTTAVELLDVENVLDNCRDLLEAVFMAANGVGDRHHMNAIQSVCDVIEHKLIEASTMVSEIRGAF